MKKTLCILFAALLLILPLSVCGFAADGGELIELTLFDDIAGYDYTTPEKFLRVDSGNVVFTDLERYSALQINDYVGDVYLEKLKPGRTYTFSWTFSPAEGHALPEKIDETNVVIDCANGAEVLYYNKTVGTGNDGCPTYFFSLTTEVTVKGNTIQMIIGRLIDVIRKILAWSPY